MDRNNKIIEYEDLFLILIGGSWKGCELIISIETDTNGNHKIVTSKTRWN